MPLLPLLLFLSLIEREGPEPKALDFEYPRRIMAVRQRRRRRKRERGAPKSDFGIESGHTHSTQHTQRGLYRDHQTTTEQKRLHDDESDNGKERRFLRGQKRENPAAAADTRSRYRQFANCPVTIFSSQWMVERPSASDVANRFLVPSPYWI